MIFRRLLRDVSFYLFTAQQVGGSKMGVADVMRLCVVLPWLLRSWLRFSVVGNVIISNYSRFSC